MLEKFNDKIYSDLLFRLVDSTDLKPYAIYYDKQSDEFFYTVRFETDAIVINNQLVVCCKYNFLHLLCYAK